MIDKIMDGLFISDAASVISQRGKRRMKELNVHRVLTVSAMPIKETDRLPGIDYKFVFMMDMTTQDILGNGLLEECLRFINTSLRDGNNVLVHCEVGISRSVTVVAAYVMRQFQWSVDKAIMFVQKARPIACPNLSFLQQLSIFEQMGYKADARALAQSSLYRNYCADTGNIPTPASQDSGHATLSPASSRPTSRMDSDTALTSSRRGSLPSTEDPQPSTKMHTLDDPEKIAEFSFRCRRCRNDLFYDMHIMYHTKGGLNFDSDLRDSTRRRGSTQERCGFEYLITPMKWMDLAEYQGKIHCPKCGEKLGQYIWGGRMCMGDNECPSFANIKQCGAFGKTTAS
ncbi:dual specificity phosphatase, catalytic domain-containing protein [Ditylenchus destructor]|uniref:protein-tyrosine-phosphatase n=1 Tax=Ditylenchus destructor TaxID=166010 RepID=A0AAD4R569_9BILA|nr:dual specificity phosphatase, catalytic domain-containing protein [Ditylenchus destructor]